MIQRFFASLFKEVGTIGRFWLLGVTVLGIGFSAAAPQPMAAFFVTVGGGVLLYAFVRAVDSLND